MNFEIFLQVLFSPFVFYAWYLVYKKYREKGGIYLLIFTFHLSLWFFLYSFVFSNSIREDLLIFILRLMYGLSMTWIYSMIIFFLFFLPNKWAVKIRNLKVLYICMAIWIVFLCIKTPYIVQGIKFIPIEDWYREIFWIYYKQFSLFYSIAIFLFFFLLFKIKRLQINSIDKARVLLIWYGFILSISLGLWVILLWPDSWIVLFEKEAIFVMVPYFISLYYSLNNYIFFNFYKKLLVVGVIFTAFLTSFFLYVLWKKVYIFLLLWDIYIPVNLKEFQFFDILLIVLLFILIRNFIYNYLVLFIKDTKNFIDNLRRDISYISSLPELREAVKNKFKTGLGIQNVSINMYKTESSELQKFFLKSKNNKVFINDPVFIEENKHKYDEKILLTELYHWSYLIFPLFKKKQLVWDIVFWKRLLWTYYTKEEVDILEGFSHLIEGHLKYIDIYSEIHDLNLNLEKRVDEKTMQYNAIINRQKEFIEVVSHEVRTPLATALFQAECLEYELKELTFTKKRKILGDVKSLYNKIVDTVSLVNKLFSIERFESNKITLYKENTDIWKMIKTQVQPYIKAHKEIDFEYEQGEYVWYMDIDVVQLKQVIDNLITNAIKFSTKVQHPKISIKLVKKKNDIVFTIEDSWLWFSWIDISSLFEKYNTGDSSSIGLGMGLYLCKKIVELHGGNISAWKSKLLWWALFKIVIPKN